MPNREGSTAVDKGWRHLVLGVFGLGAAAAVLLTSGWFPALSRQAAEAQPLPVAVAPPVGAQSAAAAAAAGSPAPTVSQNPEARIAALQQELTSSNSNSALWAELGMLSLQVRRYPTAADSYFAALELEPENNDYRTAYANALFFQGMPQMALQEFRKIVAKNPESAAAHMNLGVALSHSSPSNIENAVKEWDEVVRLSPGEPIAAKAQEYLASYRKP